MVYSFIHKGIHNKSGFITLNEIVYLQDVC